MSVRSLTNYEMRRCFKDVAVVLSVARGDDCQLLAHLCSLSDVIHFLCLHVRIVFKRCCPNNVHLLLLKVSQQPVGRGCQKISYWIDMMTFSKDVYKQACCIAFNTLRMTGHLLFVDKCFFLSCLPAAHRHVNSNQLTGTLASELTTFTKPFFMCVGRESGTVRTWAWSEGVVCEYSKRCWTENFYWFL